MPKLCVAGVGCGDSCISGQKDCLQTLGDQATAVVNKISDLCHKHKGTMASEAPVIAAGVIAGSLAGPIAGSLASATARVAVSIGKKAYARATSEEVKSALKNGESLSAIAKEAGAKFISDLKSPKFLRHLEKRFIGDLAYGSISSPINAIAKLPIIGDAIALKTAGRATQLIDLGLTKIKKAIRAY